MRVVKFGGSSLADVERLRAAAHIAASHERQAPCVVVVSAMAGVTDALLYAARLALTDQDGWRDELARIEARHRTAYRDITGGVSERFELLWRLLLADAARLPAQAAPSGSVEALAARFSGWGERLMVDLFARALTATGLVSESFVEEPVLLESLTADHHSSASEHRPTPSILATRALLTPRLALLMMRGGVPVLPGYIARDASGRVTTLGRNGSDHSAAVVSAALGAEALYIYSDVAGIYTADPRVVPEATLLPALTYAEAAEIAELGARAPSAHRRAAGALGHPAAPAQLARYHYPWHQRRARDSRLRR